MPTYCAYLDEFGHVGPFASRNDARYKTSPVFGLGGIIIPADNVRVFSTWFYKFKQSLFAADIQESGIPPFHWEMKGTKLYSTNNIKIYKAKNLNITKNIIANIRANSGHVFYVGLEKYADPAQHDSTNLYNAALTESIKRLDQYCSRRQSNFVLVLDQCGDINFRTKIVDRASMAMFGTMRCNTLIEPPIHAESHLYQNLQCADWICGLLGKIWNHELEPTQYPELDWTHVYGYKSVLFSAQSNSSVRRKRE